VPLAPPVTVIQLLLLVAVDAQVDAVVTLTMPVLAAKSNAWLVGETTNVHCACVTVNVCPPIERLPVRAAPVPLAPTVYWMVAGPVPLVLPELTVSHDGESVVAVQLHPGAESIVTLPGPPAASYDWLVEPSDVTHGCVTEMVAPVASFDSVVSVTTGTASLNV
jgi:hypothetical protein